MRPDRSAAKFVTLLCCLALMHPAFAQPPIADPTDATAGPDVASALQTATDVDRAAARDAVRAAIRDAVRVAARDEVRPVGSRDGEAVPSTIPDTLAARIDRRDPRCDLAAIAVATALVVACSASDHCGTGGRLQPTTGCKLGRLTH